MIAGGTANNMTARDCSFSGELLPARRAERGWRARDRAEAARAGGALRDLHPDARDRLRDADGDAGFFADPAAEPGAGADRRQRPPFVSYQTEAGHFQARGLRR